MCFIRAKGVALRALLGLALVLSVARFAYAQSPGDPAWKGRALVRITETAGLDRLNEPVEVVVQSDLIKAGGADIRLYDAAGLEIPYQIVGADDVAHSYRLVFGASAGANSSADYTAMFGNPQATAPAYQSVPSNLVNRTWETESVYIVWGGLSGFSGGNHFPLTYPITKLRFDDAKTGAPRNGLDRITSTTAWDTCYGWLGVDLNGPSPGGFGAWNGAISAQGPVFTELTIGGAKIRSYRGQDNWIWTNGWPCRLFNANRDWRYMKSGLTNEVLIPDLGPGDMRQFTTGYSSSTENPGYLAFRNPVNGMVFGAVAVDVPGWTIVGKCSGGWDRVIDLGDAFNRPNARVYWYSDMSNGYAGIERFSRQILNPLRVQVLADVNPPVTTARTLPASPDGSNGYFVTAPTIELAADESATTDYRWDGGLWQPYLPSLLAPEGAHTLEYCSIDSSGNKEAIKSLSVKVDTGPPTLFDLVLPPDQSLGRDISPTFSWLPSADAVSGVAEYVLFVDGLAVKTAGSAETTAALPVSLTDGEHSWFVKARDGAGNTIDSKTRTFTIDTVAPVSSIALNPDRPDGSDGFYRAPVTVTLSSTDEGSGVERTEYSSNGGQWLAYSAPFTISAPGSTEVAYRSIDRVGNTEVTKRETVKIKQADLEHPEAEIHFDPRTRDITVAGFDGPAGSSGSGAVSSSYKETALRRFSDGDDCDERTCCCDDGCPDRDGRCDGEDDGCGYCDGRREGREDDCADRGRPRTESGDDDSRSGWKLRTYSLKDEAGNSLVLNVAIQKSGREIKAKVTTLSYNGAAETKAPANSFKYEWTLDKEGGVKKLNQRVWLKGKGRVNARYDARSNKTTITAGDEGERSAQPVRTGLVLIEVLSGDGLLSYRY